MRLHGIGNNDCSIHALAASTDPDVRRQYAHIKDLLRRQAAERPDVDAHAVRVGLMAGRITHVLGGSVAQQRTMRLAGMLHDIGKIHTPARILDKPAKLTRGEFFDQSVHTDTGLAMLEEVPGKVTRFMGEVALKHHERPDGKGYHYLPGSDVPLAARIVAVADQSDALLFARKYKAGFTIQDTLEIMTRQWAVNTGEKPLDDRVLAAWVNLAVHDRAAELEQKTADHYLEMASPHMRQLSWPSAVGRRASFGKSIPQYAGT